MGASISRRYKFGMRPKKYFKNKVMPEMKETFAILGFSYQHAYTLFKAFIEIGEKWWNVYEATITTQTFHSNSSSQISTTAPKLRWWSSTSSWA